MLNADLNRHRREVARALAAHKYDKTDAGLFIPGMHATVGGVFDHWLNHADHQVDPNLVPTQGLDWVLSVLVKNSTPVATWYIAPFEGNYTPAAGLTAATFTATATEFTSYDEAARVEFNEGAVSGGSVSNSANKADFTISTGVTNKALYGVALLSASAKSATTGTILAATRFAATRLVNATDVLTVQYTLTLTSA